MASKFKLMFVLMTVIVTVSMSLLNIQIPNWNEIHLPIFSFLDDTSENTHHTKSRYSKIAVIRESDLPFVSTDEYETNDNIPPSYGKKPVFHAGGSWDVPIFEEEMPTHIQF